MKINSAELVEFEMHMNSLTEESSQLEADAIDPVGKLFAAAEFNMAMGGTHVQGANCANFLGHAVDFDAGRWGDA